MPPGKTGRSQPAPVEIDNFSGGSGQPGGAGIRTGIDDPAIRYGHGLHPASRRIHGVDGAVAQNEVGGAAILSTGENGRDREYCGGAEKRGHSKQLTLPQAPYVYNVRRLTTS